MSTETHHRGGGWVAVQFALEAAVLLVAVLAPGRSSPPSARFVAGAVVLAAGIVLLVVAARALGSALTAYPRPVTGAPISRGGPYRLVRHPIYSALMLIGLGASVAGSPWALGPTAALALLLDRKATKEEAWLAHAHPEYDALRAAVRWRFLPRVR